MVQGQSIEDFDPELIQKISSLNFLSGKDAYLKSGVEIIAPVLRRRSARALYTASIHLKITQKHQSIIKIYNQENTIRNS